LIDGNRFRYIKQIPLSKMPNRLEEETIFKNYAEIPYSSIIKGDGKYLSIAAASILAKTYRDDYMLMIHEKNPQYNWKSNKGYPTVDHRNAIREFGITSHHRKTYKLLDDQLSLDF